MEIQNLEDFGRRMSAKEISDFLGISIATVYKKYRDYGGMRVGRKYIFFENVFRDSLKQSLTGKKNDEAESLILPGFADAVQNESGLGGSGSYSGREADAPLPDPQGGVGVGAGTAAYRQVLADLHPEDVHKLLA